MTKLALVDCNNFYVSCERLFRPDLWNRPVAVLSNNDGCIVARSQEVKALGIKMATPLHQVQHLIRKHQVTLFSSNYPLYADLSNRVSQCLEMFTPHLEVYSIDESFLDLTDVTNDITAYGQTIKHKVFQMTGIPVSVGIAPTKTLAKLANYAAKKWSQTGGVLDLSDPSRVEHLLRKVEVDEVWGIGGRTAQRLHIMGVNTAYDLAQQPAERIQAQFNIVIARTVMELNGTPCLSLQEITPPKQQIVCSRSFKKRLTDYQELANALSCFCNRAAEKLRQQNSVAGSVTVSIRTNPFQPKDPQYQRSAYMMLNRSSQDTRLLLASALSLLKSLYKPGYRYHKCAIQLGHIQAAAAPQQADLFAELEDEPKKSRQLMAAIDQINQRYHRGIAVSETRQSRQWQTPVEHLSPKRTTDWNELAKVRC